MNDRPVPQPPLMVEVPDLLGLAVSEVALVARELGLVMKQVVLRRPIYERPDLKALWGGRQPGVVEDQLPEPGTWVERGDWVVVIAWGDDGDGGVREPQPPWPPVGMDRAARGPDQR